MKGNVDEMKMPNTKLVPCYALFKKKPNMIEDVKMFLCRGKVIDELEFEENKSEFNIRKVMVTFPDDYQIPNGGTIVLIQYYSGNDCGHWFSDPICAKAEAINYWGSAETFRTATLHLSMFEPVQFPKVVFFERNEKGNLYFQMETHPEHRGSLRDGKFYFPDKYFKDPDIGYATIEQVVEKGTFGFAIGYMQKFEQELQDGDAKFAIRQMAKKYPGRLVLVIDHPSRGLYYALATESDGKFKYEAQVIQFGHVNHLLDGYTQIVNNDLKYLLRKCPIEEF